MLGVLLAVDAEGKQHILKAFSGQITKCWYIPGELVDWLADQSSGWLSSKCCDLHHAVEAGCCVLYLTYLYIS